MTTPESHPFILSILYSSLRGNFIPDPPQTVAISAATFLSGLVRFVEPGKALLRAGKDPLSVTNCCSISRRSFRGCSTLSCSRAFNHPRSDVWVLLLHRPVHQQHAHSKILRKWPDLPEPTYPKLISSPRRMILSDRRATPCNCIQSPSFFCLLLSSASSSLEMKMGKR